MSWLSRILNLRAESADVPSPTQVIGQIGENAAKAYLAAKGMRFLMANFRGRRGEIDLVFRDTESIVFVEVKSRKLSSWTRPSAAVSKHQKRLTSKTALEYLRLCNNPEVTLRFDIVEVLTIEDEIVEVRHLVDAFPLASPYRYG